MTSLMTYLSIRRNNPPSGHTPRAPIEADEMPSHVLAVRPTPIPGGSVVDIPNRYTSDVVSYRQARVAQLLMVGRIPKGWDMEGGF
jgi:hypothetical protein